MSKPVERVEVITGRERRRRYTADEKARLVEETTSPCSLARSAASAAHEDRVVALASNLIRRRSPDSRRPPTSGAYSGEPARAGTSLCSPRQRPARSEPGPPDL
jgi:transposase-like protein